MFKSVPSMNKEDRRRGRPAGKNRIPLSLVALIFGIMGACRRQELYNIQFDEVSNIGDSTIMEERRARNAQYERERRNETTEAMTQLAEAVGCDAQVSNADLLATVVSRLQRASKKKSHDLDDIKRINDNLESQIAILLARLGNDVNIDELELKDEHEDDKRSFSDSSKSESENIKPKRPRKYIKKSKSNTVHDRIHSESESESSSESQSSTYSDWSEERKRKIRKHSGKFLQVTNDVTNIESKSNYRSVETSERSRTEYESSTDLIPQSSSSRTASESSLESLEANQNAANLPVRPLTNENIGSNFEEIIQAVVEEQGIKIEEMFSPESDHEDRSVHESDPFTDNEKGLLNELLGGDLFGVESLDNQEQNWPFDFDNFLSGF